MNRTPYRILRIGIAITFLWIGVLIFQYPEAWGNYLQPWAAELLPIPIEQAMISAAILDIVIGIFLLIDIFTWIAAFLGAIHLFIVLTISGITSVTVRDIGLLAATIALFVDTFPVEKFITARKGRN